MTEIKKLTLRDCLEVMKLSEVAARTQNAMVGLSDKISNATNHSEEELQSTGKLILIMRELVDSLESLAQMAAKDDGFEGRDYPAVVAELVKTHQSLIAFKKHNEFEMLNELVRTTINDLTMLYSQLLYSKIYELLDENK